jgi:hypothetical protein
MLVDSILADNQKIIQAAGQATESVTGIVEGLTDTVGAIKTPLAKYMPFAVLGVLVFVIIRYGSKK